MRLTDRRSDQFSHHLRGVCHDDAAPDLLPFICFFPVIASPSAAPDGSVTNPGPGPPSIRPIPSSNLCCSVAICSQIGSSGPDKAPRRVRQFLNSLTSPEKRPRETLHSAGIVAHCYHQHQLPHTVKHRKTFVSHAPRRASSVADGMPSSR
jgi:hypothetical protein